MSVKAQPEIEGGGYKWLHDLGRRSAAHRRVMRATRGKISCGCIFFLRQILAHQAANDLRYGEVKRLTFPCQFIG